MSAVPVRTRLGVISLCLVVTALVPSPAPAQVPTRPDSAEVAAARRWLAQLDSGHYAASLDSAAPLLRQMAGSTDAWRQLVSQARKGFPPNPSRSQVEFDPAPDVSGAPAGRYVRITFRVGANAATVYEVVVLQATAQGWRVAMYGTRPG